MKAPEQIGSLYPVSKADVVAAYQAQMTYARLILNGLDSFEQRTHLRTGSWRESDIRRARIERDARARWRARGLGLQITFEHEPYEPPIFALATAAHDAATDLQSCARENLARMKLVAGDVVYLSEADSSAMMRAVAFGSEVASSEIPGIRKLIADALAAPMPEAEEPQTPEPKFESAHQKPKGVWATLFSWGSN